MFIQFDTQSKFSRHTNECISENWYKTGKYFNLFTHKRLGKKDKRVNHTQLVYSCISSCLLLAEEELHSSLYSWVITYSILLYSIILFVSLSANIYVLCSINKNELISIIKVPNYLIRQETYNQKMITILLPFILVAVRRSMKKFSTRSAERFAVVPH